MIESAQQTPPAAAFSGDPSEEQLAALLRDQPPAAADPAPVPILGTPPAAAAPAPTPHLAVGRRFIIPAKSNAKQLEQLRQGVAHSQIKHIKLGTWASTKCICVECVTKREQWLDDDAPAAAAGNDAVPGQDAATRVVKNLVTENVCAHAVKLLMVQPGELVGAFKGWPKEAMKLWETDAEEMKVYGELGKAIFDKYVNVPGFKYSEEVMLGLTSFIHLGTRVTGTIAILKLKGVQQ